DFKRHTLRGKALHSGHAAVAGKGGAALKGHREQDAGPTSDRESFACCSQPASKTRRIAEHVGPLPRTITKRVRRQLRPPDTLLLWWSDVGWTIEAISAAPGQLRFSGGEIERMGQADEYKVDAWPREHTEEDLRAAVRAGVGIVAVAGRRRPIVSAMVMFG